MKKHARRVDANQSAVVSALRQIGCTVFVASSVGGGFPDLVVGYRNRTMLIELKDGDKPKSARKLTIDQMFFSAMWRGHYVVVNNVDEAIAAVVEATNARGYA